MDDADWERTFAVNVTGIHTVAEEARAIWIAQELDGTLTVTTSANAVVSKKGSLAYDASKAAANHLVRELAMELAPRVRVNGVAPATVVEGSTMFPRERIIASLTRYELPFCEDEDTDTLKEKLSAFYARRTLLGRCITPREVAAAIRFLLGPGAARTTGHILAVDGGLQEAFLR